MDEAGRAAAEMLAAHEPPPMDEATARALDDLVERAAAADAATTKGR